MKKFRFTLDDMEKASLAEIESGLKFRTNMKMSGFLDTQIILLKKMVEDKNEKIARLERLIAELEGGREKKD